VQVAALPDLLKERRGIEIYRWRFSIKDDFACQFPLPRLLIAYFRPGAELIPESRGFTTSRAALNVAIDAHAFISDALEWLCAFHAAYALWYWRIRGTQWGKTANVWLERGVSATSRMAAWPLRGKNFRL